MSALAWFVIGSVLYLGGGLGLFWIAARHAVDDPSEDYQAARLEEWTVDDRELPDFDWRLAR